MRFQAPQAEARIQVGRRVIHHGSCGINRHGVITAIAGDRLDIATFDGYHFQPLTSFIGKPGIGRVDLLDKVHGPRLIEVAKAAVAERIARENTERLLAAQQHAWAVEKVKADNPHLIPAAEYAGPAHAARNIRIEFKSAGIKARIRSRKYTGGSAIDITVPHATSDATLRAAEAIAKKYQAGNFNGYDDCYEYVTSAWCDAFGAARYIHVDRQAKGVA